MHIPPYYKKESWQRFFAGACIGMVISFVIFIYMHGQFYEKWVEENLTLHAKITELERQKEVLLDSKKEIDEMKKEKVTVNTIEVTITNDKELKLDRLIAHQIEEKIKTEIQKVIGQDIVSLSENDHLLISTIENNAYRVEDITYFVEVNQLVIAPILRIHIALNLHN